MRVEIWEGQDRIVVEHDETAIAFTIEEAEEAYFRLGVALREANAEAEFVEFLCQEAGVA